MHIKLSLLLYFFSHIVVAFFPKKKSYFACTKELIKSITVFRSTLRLTSKKAPRETKLKAWSENIEGINLLVKNEV